MVSLHLPAGTRAYCQSGPEWKTDDWRLTAYSPSHVPQGFSDST
jgi:hypothetical protein